MCYYSALEPLLRRLGQNTGVSPEVMARANDHIVVIYQHVLEFQLRSVLRFYETSLGRYLRDLFPKPWNQMKLDFEKLEATVNGNLSQINDFISRQELESLNKTSTESFGNMQKLLSVSEQQLRVAEEQRDIAQKGLKMQEDEAKQKLSDKEEKCLQLFRLTSSTEDVTYEWYKDRVENRVQNTCQWFLYHDHFLKWLERDSGPLLVSADPECGKSVLAKYLIDHGLSRSSTICYFFFKDQVRTQPAKHFALCSTNSSLRIRP